MAQRLGPRPAGALVLGVDTFSGRLWPEGKPVDIDHLRIVGSEILMLPERAAASPTGTHARQVLAWGNLGQSRLTGAHVAIVGGGGTGSQIAVQLAHLGVGRITLIDFDTVEQSNLSRIVGSRPEDVGQAKVAVLKAALQAINPNIQVHGVAQSVIDVDPLLFADVDVAVCATDGHGSRALLTELAQQYLLPVVDLGVDVIPTADGAHRACRPESGRGRGAGKSCHQRAHGQRRAA